MFELVKGGEQALEYLNIWKVSKYLLFLIGLVVLSYLGGDDIHFVDHVEDEVEDAFLLEQVLPVPQRLQELLPVLVAGEFVQYFTLPVSM